jgi:hypothetical protein
LLAGHLIQNQLQSDSKESGSVRKGKSRVSLTDKVFRILLSVVGGWLANGSDAFGGYPRPRPLIPLCADREEQRPQQAAFAIP